VRVQEAKLYSRPARAPLVFGAALSEETAETVGGFCDGLATVGAPPEQLRRMLDAFRRGGGEGKPIYLQAQLSFAATEEKALEAAWDQWRSVMFPSPVLATLRMPADFDAIGETVRREDVRRKVRVSADPEQHLRWVAEYAEMGFEEINVHNVCREEQERFIEVFGQRVLPELRG
jgi:alkanesulfonate monooxygenase SsuD/methylene tetrahydromethanopterin reductase-like flavin-dependent oxidoreductase (luciferase family)